MREADIIKNKYKVQKNYLRISIKTNISCEESDVNIKFLRCLLLMIHKISVKYENYKENKRVKESKKAFKKFSEYLKNEDNITKEMLKSTKGHLKEKNVNYTIDC